MKPVLCLARPSWSRSSAAAVEVGRPTILSAARRAWREALVEVGTKGREWVREIKEMLPMVLIVSQVELLEGEKIIARKASGAKCERCWMWSDSVGKDKKHSTLCSRCAKVVKSIQG